MRDAAINLRSFMLEAACERAQQVLLDQVFFGLDAKRFREFTAILDAPLGPNPGLDRLMAVKAPWSQQPE